MAQACFTYNVSDPLAVTRTGNAEEGYTYTLPGAGALRLWTKDAHSARNGALLSADEPGDLVPSGVAFPLSRLAFTDGVATLWLEGVRPGTAAQTIAVTVDPDGDGPLSALLTDTVKVTPITIEFVVPTTYDETTGLPTGEGKAVTRFVGVSDPRPTVELAALTTADLQTSGGYVRFSLDVTVKDPIADNLPTEAGADIANVVVTVDGRQYGSAHPLTREADGEPSFWRQHPYKGVAGPIPVRVALSEGTHVVSVRRNAPIAERTRCYADSPWLRYGSGVAARSQSWASGAHEGGTGPGCSKNRSPVA